KKNAPNAEEPGPSPEQNEPPKEEPIQVGGIKISPKLSAAARTFGIPLDEIIQYGIAQEQRIARLEAWANQITPIMEKLSQLLDKIPTTTTSLPQTTNQSAPSIDLSSLAPLISIGQQLLGGGNPLEKLLMDFLASSLNNTLTLQSQQIRMNQALLSALAKKGLLEEMTNE
ncbi:MAG: hypothetical protein KIH08_17335, partial [Candidatus Freyarchaeota archaeon]|nr:hypothetical protein [Candidatus Jordarchaeia archaeon]